MGKKRFGYGDYYCWRCGANIETNMTWCPSCGASYEGAYKYGDKPALGAGGVGWSPHAEHKTFAAYFKRNRNAFWIFMVILSLIIGVVLFVIPGELDFDAEGLKIYLGVLAIVWGIDLLWYYFNNKSRNDWVGVVEKKEVKEYTRRTRDKETGHTHTEYHTRFIVHFRKNDGRPEKLSVTDSPAWYEYLNVGDRVRYHGKKGMNYYEKYDKSHDESIPCAGCGSRRDAREIYCGRCGCILLKVG